MKRPDIDYVDLPNGRTITVCADHHQVVCGRCCLDFSLEVESGYDDENEEGGLERLERRFFEGRNVWSDDSDDDLFGFDLDSKFPRDVTLDDVANSKYGRRRNEDRPSFSINSQSSDGGGRYVIPARFIEKNDNPLTPQDLFPRGVGKKSVPPVTRFINRRNKSEFLVYTDGACLDNGGDNARAGCAFVFEPASSEGNGAVAFRLEEHGADGKVYKHTSNRAELRAVIAALHFRHWPGEGFNSIVIATDSTYVVDGATDWVRAWIRKGWRLSSGQHVKNPDLWDALLLRVKELHDMGMRVLLWNIPRKWNHVADQAAKDAAATGELRPTYTAVEGCLRGAEDGGN